ncbi:minor capsid protein [Streptococcus suis]|uniref:minor capsid protein n=1 Tax=Streptococcus suis TaxID=1307 RepID=UPI0028767047|nr:minor capsid protein [Streptococcus suis]MDS1161629.1 minor capsid protein [Streptococcus suis]
MTIELSKHWKERYDAEEQRRAKSDEDLERQLDAIYKQHIAEIQKEIDAFWQRYADKNGITKLEAKKQADKLDMDVVSYKAKQLVARAEKWRKEGRKVTQKDFTKAENDLMKLYNLKMKTSRLEVLQANLKLHQYELAMNELEATERHLIEAVRQENLYSAGILRDTLGSYQTAKTSTETIVYANFHGSNWSTKIWERQDALREVVRKSVADTILRGKGTQLLIRQLEKEFKVSYEHARRLAVTETARVYSEAQKANYKANDFEYYEILAESGACNICKPYDEKHYKVDDMAPGHNAPPFHPNCRCTTVPYFEKEEQPFEAKTPEEIDNFFREQKSYQKWYNSLEDEGKKAINLYTTTAHETINNALRQGVATYEKEYLSNFQGDDLLFAKAVLEERIGVISVLKGSIKGFKTEKPFKTYRGVSFWDNDDDVYKNLSESQILQLDKAFISSSLDKKAIKDFAVGGIEYRFEFIVPKGFSKGAYISELSDISSEKEFLFSPDSTFRIKSINKKGMTTNVVAEVLND